MGFFLKHRFFSQLFEQPKLKEKILSVFFGVDFLLNKKITIKLDHRFFCWRRFLVAWKKIAHFLEKKKHVEQKTQCYHGNLRGVETPPMPRGNPQEIAGLIEGLTTIVPARWSTWLGAVGVGGKVIFTDPKKGSLKRGRCHH